MIVPMKKGCRLAAFFISITDRRLFLHRSACPNGEHPYQKMEDGKTVLHLFLIENIQQVSFSFVRSVYD
ncbi:hypothetical protein ACQRBP_07180 [Eubacteriales bacterium SGI.150]